MKGTIDYSNASSWTHQRVTTTNDGVEFNKFKLKQVEHRFEFG